jgi:hypothetical protein
MLLLSFCTNAIKAQLIISGTVYDSTKIYGVKNVKVISTGGITTYTDSLGGYKIVANENDSIWFYYQNKPTAKFPVRSITNLNNFDISLRVRVADKYKALKEVVVYGKSYRQDSIENRMTYSNIFNTQKPGLHSSFTPGSPPGFDLDAIINVFRFKHNKEIKAFQNRLLAEERDHYIDYKFNKKLVKRITGLDSANLARFMKEYRPPYEFAVLSSQLEFYQYILDASYKYKSEMKL